MTCLTCYGEGFVITCCDDLCAGEDRCIHGDGEEACPDCNGSGEYFDYVDDDEGREDDTPLFAHAEAAE